MSCPAVKKGMVNNRGKIYLNYIRRITEIEDFTLQKLLFSIKNRNKTKILSMIV